MEVLNNNKIIGEPIKGGMGQVFHLYNQYWKIDLAMKQPLEKYMQSSAQKEMFIHECEKWMSLGVHPNIVQCYYVGEVNHRMSAFMEWMPGGTLKDIINQGNIYESDNRTKLLFILEIALQMAIGLRYSHSKGVLHLDMKPANVLIGENFNVKISDFGISSYLYQSVDKILYTPLYCAPEQRNKKNLSKATDIYCYGVTLLHLVCGEAVWHDGVVAGLAHNTILKKYSKIEIPSELQKVFDKCLEKNEEDRFNNFDEIIELLGKCWDQLNIGSIYKYYPEFYDNVSNSTNNIALSYYNLDNTKKAKNKWVLGYYRFPYHQANAYNLNLYNYKYDKQIEYYTVTMLSKNFEYSEDYDKYLESRFCVSTKAYEKAKRISNDAIKKAIINRPNYLDLYLASDEYIKQRYNENGPKVFFEMNFKNILKVDSIEKDCACFGMINNQKIIYISKTGNLTILDLKEKMVRKGTTGLSNISKSTMSMNGQYMALCQVDLSNKKDNKVYHIINIYDLKNEVIKIKLTIKGYYESCESLFFINQSNITPTLIMKTKDKYYDFNVIEDSITIENNEFDSHQYQFDYNQPLLHLQEVYGDFVLGMSQNKNIIFESSNMILTETQNFEKVYPTTMKSSPTQPYIFVLNEKGYTVFDTLNLRYITNEEFDKKILQFSISPDGKQLCILNDTQLQIRKMPDYSIEEKSLWEISPFHTTKKIMADVDYAKKQEKEVYQLLNETLDDSKIERIKKAIYTVRKHLEYERYLNLNGLLALKIGFRKTNTRLTFTDKDLEFYPMNKNGKFIDFDELSIIDCNNKVQLVDKNQKCITTINCKFDEIIGLSKQYCYLVCKTNQDTYLKYKLYELEWLS